MVLAGYRMSLNSLFQPLELHEVKLVELLQLSLEELVELVIVLEIQNIYGIIPGCVRLHN